MVCELTGLCNHNDAWLDLYSNEAENIRDSFRENLLGIHHIGSTSVQGLVAKPKF